MHGVQSAEVLLPVLYTGMYLPAVQSEQAAVLATDLKLPGEQGEHVSWASLTTP
jgi:hypothetical protein